MLLPHLALLALGIGLSACFARTAAEWTSGLAAVASIIVAIAVLHVVGPRSYRRGHVRSGIMAGALARWLLYATVCVGLPYGVGSAPHRYGVVLYAAAFMLLLVFYLPLLGKVRPLELGQASSLGLSFRSER